MSFTIRIDNEYCSCRSHPRSCTHYKQPLKTFIEFQVTEEQFQHWLQSKYRHSEPTIQLIDRFGDNVYYHPDPKKWWGKHYNQSYMDSYKIDC